MNDENKKSNFDRKKWVHKGNCKPEIAASLIIGVNPDDEKILSPDYFYGGIKIHFKQVKEITDILCNGGLPSYMFSDRNIFHYANKYLENNYPVYPINEDLLKAINEFYLFLLEEDQNTFTEDYPYLMREIKKIPTENQPPLPNGIDSPDTTKDGRTTEQSEALYYIAASAYHAGNKMMTKKFLTMLSEHSKENPHLGYGDYHSLYVKNGRFHFKKGEKKFDVATSSLNRYFTIAKNSALSAKNSALGVTKEK